MTSYEANKQSRDKQRQAMRLTRMDLPSPILSPAAGVATGFWRAQYGVKSTPLETYDAKMIRRKGDEGQETYLGGGGFQEWPDDTRFCERSVGGVAPSKAAPTTHWHI